MFLDAYYVPLTVRSHQILVAKNLGILNRGVARDNLRGTGGPGDPRIREHERGG